MTGEGVAGGESRLEDAAAQVYAAAPGDFVATRSRLAKQAKADGEPEIAKQIAALRKPSVAAWAVNHLVRRRPDLVEQLTDLGERLRSAQTRLDAAALRTLRGERDVVLRTMTQAAAEQASEAGQRLAPSVLDQVRDTVVAALASAEATQAVGSGTLTRALAYSGFGDVDIADAVARTATGVPLAVIRGGRSAEATPAETIPAGDDATSDGELARTQARRQRAERERLEGARREAEFALARAERDLETATVTVQRAREASEAARTRLAQLRADLAQAEADDDARLIEVSDAVRHRTEAQSARDAAAATLRDLPDLY